MGKRKRRHTQAKESDKIVRGSESDESSTHLAYLLAYPDSRLSNKEARQPQCVACVDAPLSSPCSRILNELSRRATG